MDERAGRGNGVRRGTNIRRTIVESTSGLVVDVRRRRRRRRRRTEDNGPLSCRDGRRCPGRRERDRGRASPRSAQDVVRSRSTRRAGRIRETTRIVSERSERRGVRRTRQEAVHVGSREVERREEGHRDGLRVSEAEDELRHVLRRRRRGRRSSRRRRRRSLSPAPPLCRGRDHRIVVLVVVLG